MRLMADSSDCVGVVMVGAGGAGGAGATVARPTGTGAVGGTGLEATGSAALAAMDARGTAGFAATTGLAGTTGGTVGTGFFAVVICLRPYWLQSEGATRQHSASGAVSGVLRKLYGESARIRYSNGTSDLNDAGWRAGLPTRRG